MTISNAIEAHKAAWMALEAACKVTDDAFGTEAEGAAEKAQEKASDDTASAIDAIVEYPDMSPDDLREAIRYLSKHHRATGDGDAAAWIFQLACRWAEVAEECL